MPSLSRATCSSLSLLALLLAALAVAAGEEDEDDDGLPRSTELEVVLRPVAPEEVERTREGTAEAAEGGEVTPPVAAPGERGDEAEEARASASSVARRASEPLRWSCGRAVVRVDQ